MGIEVHVLGTSSARPTNIRQVSGSLISCDEGIAVVDAGEGFQSRFSTQRKRMKNHESYHLKSSRVAVLCLTHGHLDHTWGVLPWLQSMALDNRNQPLLIIGPTSDKVVESLLNNTTLPDDTPHSDLSLQFQFWHKLGGTSENLGYEVRWVLGDVSGDRWVEFDTSTGKVIQLPKQPQPQAWRKNRIDALATVHGIPSCAWKLSTKEKPGKFDRKRAIELGLNDEQRAQLAAGNDILHNEKTLLAKQFRGEDFQSISAVISGDTTEMAPGITQISGCNLLIHEATFLNDWTKHAEDYLHSTAAGAARTAIKCNAQHLVLTHYGARIKGPNDSIDEAQEVLSNTDIRVTAALDGDRLLVGNDGLTTHLHWRDDGWTR